MGEVHPPADECLYIQFARAPQAGAVKTRMQPHLDARGACELHCELLAYTSLQLSRVEESPRELWVAGNASHAWLSRVAEYHGMGLREQRGADLGERMLHALRDGLSRYRRVVLVGSDCPGLDLAYLREAASLLHRTDMVWGPAVDGGYVLVGARRVSAACFSGIAWGGNRVMSRTLELASEAGIRHALLPARADVDRPADLAGWQRVRRQMPDGGEVSGSPGGLLAEGLRCCAGAE